MNRWITLRLEVAEDVHPDDVAVYLNAEALEALLDDEKMITAWEWSELGEEKA